MGSKIKGKERIRYRIRKKISGTPEKPRLSIFRSNKSIYCQLIDDTQGVTLASAQTKGSNAAAASEAGKLIAEKAKAKNVETCVFDRGGNLYHGRVKALADAAREAGLQF